MKPMARFLTLTFTFIAALSLGCDTQQPSGLRSTLALDKSAARGNGGGPEGGSGGREGRPAETSLVFPRVVTFPPKPPPRTDIAVGVPCNPRGYTECPSHS